MFQEAAGPNVPRANSRTRFIFEIAVSKKRAQKGHSEPQKQRGR
jgi:hypothetical protein